MHTEYIIALHRGFNTISRQTRVKIKKLRKNAGGTEIMYITKEEVDREMYLQNIAHFEQPETRAIPFSKNPVLQHFGRGATTSEATDLVKNPNHEIPKNIHPLAT